MEPLVSIVTPMYNSEKFIEETIETVLNQTYQNWEMIIIDDCSTDSSKDVVRKFIRKDNRIKYFKNYENSGPAVSRNNGILKTEGKYIAFLDSDDLWIKEKLEKQIKFMEENNIKMCHGNYYFGNEQGEKIKKITTSKCLDYKELLKNNQIKTSYLIVKKEIIKEKEFPKIKHEDYAYFLDILREGITSERIDEVLGVYRLNSLSISSNKIKSSLWTWQIYRNYEKFSIFKSLYYFIFYILKSLQKYKKI